MNLSILRATWLVLSIYSCCSLNSEDANDKAFCLADDNEVLLQTSTASASINDAVVAPLPVGAGSIADDQCPTAYPLWFTTDFLWQIGHVPRTTECHARDVQLVLAQIPVKPDELGPDEDGFVEPKKMNAFVANIPYGLIVIYVFFVITLVTMILQSVFFHAPMRKGDQAKYPEDHAYKQGLITWLWMSWASPWIARWGNAIDSAKTKIHSDDVPLSSPGDEIPVNYEFMQKVWDAEVSRVGLLNANLLKVVTRFITWRYIGKIVLWNSFYEAFLYLGPPNALSWVTTYFNQLYIKRNMGSAIEPWDLFWPTLMLMVVFTGLPVMMAVCNTVSLMMNNRIAIRISGALSVLAYKKAMRLPCAIDDEALISSNAKAIDGEADNLNFESAQEKSTKKLAGMVGLVGAAASLGKFTRTKEEKELEMSLNIMPKRFNLSQLIERDVNVNIMAIPLSCARMVVMIPVLVSIFCMLIAKVGWSFIFCIGVALFNTVFMGIVTQYSRYVMGGFYNVAGQRLNFTQQILFGMRFIKGFGGERLVMKTLSEMRELELSVLFKYYSYLCVNMSFTTVFPKIYCMASLYGLIVFKGESLDPVLIFSVMPILDSLQAAIGNTMMLFPTVILAIPSCMRLQTFLTQAEHARAPMMLKDSQEVQVPWVGVWPAKGVNPDWPRRYQVQGSFRWQPVGLPVLHDIDFSVAHGSLVGVLGGVGSGKSTFLTAMIGELYPFRETHLEVPEKVAYSSQVPHIFEGSLRENVVLGDDYDEKRYREALFEACLLPDLEVLPGGDSAPVGGRGITLSGGQKARVSMARSAYFNSADAVLLDDPFGAVDAFTATHLEEHLIHGPLMKGRTRIVVLQPDNERLKRFDWLVIMDKGMIAVQGQPAEVLECEEYQKLQCIKQEESEEIVLPEDKETAPVVDMPASTQDQKNFVLREEECEGRASRKTLLYFYFTGGWVSLTVCIVLYLAKNVTDMKGATALARWMSDGSMWSAGLLAQKPNPYVYLLDFIYWFFVSVVFWVTCWIGGQRWTLQTSRVCFNQMMWALLRAPLDRFYDKTPVGRVMNRLANDMMNIDLQVYTGICSTIGMIWTLCTPAWFVHLNTPFWFTCATAPMYYLVVMLIGMYWKTMVPMRYLMTVSKSAVQEELSDIEVTNPTIRAYKLQDFKTKVFTLAMRRQICADFVGTTLLMRWLTNRLFVIGGMFVTMMSLIVIWVPGAIDVGTASLCTISIFHIVVSVESCLGIGAVSQYQVIAMNRVFEYTKLPSERPNTLPTDKPYITSTIKAIRGSLKKLEVVDREEGTVLVDKDTGKVLLHKKPDLEVLTTAEGVDFVDLIDQPKGWVNIPGICERWKALKDFSPKTHNISSVNGTKSSAKAMMQELAYGESDGLQLRLESTWLQAGVAVEFSNLTCGYADCPRDVLKNVNLSLPRGCKAGVCGSTGCGKSTMLLTLLRVIEPRGGRVALEGVDICDLGLETLRQAIGLVPQDPVLLQGSLRFNLDPFEQYSNEEIWKALRCVQMANFFETAKDGGLEFNVMGEGANLSFGQRQLLSLARNVLRQPMLLLLDECTSAIDPATQELVQETIFGKFPQSTLVVIAHRLETIMGVDRIVLLHQGVKFEDGSPQELYKQGGRFARMCQARGVLPKALPDSAKKQ